MTDPTVIEVPTRRFDDARLAWVAILVLLVNVVSLPSGWPHWPAVALAVFRGGMA